jgi:hypothetical protein
MPPKKKDGKGKKGKAPDVSPEDIDMFKKSYTNMCRDAGLQVYEPLIKKLNTEEDRDELVQNQQLLIHPENPQDPNEVRLGPGGARTLCTTILGIAPGMDKPFKAVKSIRCWQSKIGDDGACSFAEVLRLGGAECQLQYLELIDNQIGARGCRALGVAIMVGGNKSLQTLKLDHNPNIGVEGVANICRGLRSNCTLLQLHLPFCGIDPIGARPLSEALAFRALGLKLLNLQGNRLGDEGLAYLCPGLEANQSLVELNLADNGIGTNPHDLNPMSMFAGVISGHKTITKLDLNYNRLCLEAANALLPGLVDPIDPTKSHPRLVKVEIDAALNDIPPELYAQLRVEKAGGKKGKKGKKKK